MSLPPPPNSRVGALTPNARVFGDEAFERQLGLDEVIRAGHHDGLMPPDRDTR